MRFKNAIDLGNISFNTRVWVHCDCEFQEPKDYPDKKNVCSHAKFVKKIDGPFGDIDVYSHPRQIVFEENEGLDGKAVCLDCLLEKIRSHGLT